MPSNTPETQALFPVTQADRDAAASLVAWHNKAASEWKTDGGNDLTFFAADMPDGIRRGIWDEHDVVQAFARHRQSSSNAGVVGVEYCSHCQCDACDGRNRDQSNRSAIAMDAGARCWSCSCGWVGCYTGVEIAQYGEPSECAKCYRERLEECEQPKALASLSTPTAEPMGAGDPLHDLRRSVAEKQAARERDNPPVYVDTSDPRFAVGATTPPTPDRIGKDAVREADEHYTVAMERRPKEIGGVKVGPGLYRIHWKDGGSSLAAIGMCRNGAWWVAPTNWVEPAVAFRIDEDPQGRWSWAGVKALERLDPDALSATPAQEGEG